MMRRHFLHACESGVALIEFALVLPILILMLVGMLELTYYSLINQKLDKIANSMADFVTQGSTVSVTDLNTFGQAVPQIMRPYTFTGTIVFSSVANFAVPTAPCLITNTSCISWQRAILGGSSSQIGSVGGGATLPAGYTVSSGQNVIVAEAYLQYTPILSASSNFIAAFTPQTLYKIAIYKPRQGTLTVLAP